MTRPSRASGSGTPSASRGAFYGLTAAALFGASTPVAKLLVPGTGPFVLAGLLYLGAGLGLALAGPFRRAGIEAPLRRADLPILLVVIVAGGVTGPLLLLLGLARLPGATAALLLNLETVFTIAIAVAFLREHLSRREAAGAVAVVAGAATLTWAPGALAADPVGAGLVAAACAAWAIDNGLSQRLADRDPVAVARAKTLAAGAFNVALGTALGESTPSAGHAAGALLAGALGYGLSIVLHLLAVRSAGAARQAAYFGTAPFIGAVLAVPLLGDVLPPAHLAAGAAMAVGIAVIVRARHGHAHVHEDVVHEHGHTHDEHHRHAHDGPVVEPHSHLHQHAPLVHDHPHLPDAHHRHTH